MDHDGISSSPPPPPHRRTSQPWTDHFCQIQKGIFGPPPSQSPYVQFHLTSSAALRIQLPSLTTNITPSSPFVLLPRQTKWIANKGHQFINHRAATHMHTTFKVLTLHAPANAQPQNLEIISNLIGSAAPC